MQRRTYFPCDFLYHNIMGRPVWATDEQWVWLKDQATEYLKVKGTKETCGS